MNSDIRILAVEDDNDSMTMLCHYLKEIGHRNIAHAQDPQRAFALLEAQTFDLIISDRYMPGMDGLEFYQALQARPACKDIPFLMTTSEGQKDKITEAIRAGVKHYITKPVDTDNLRTKINRLLEKPQEPPCPSA